MVAAVAVPPAAVVIAVDNVRNARGRVHVDLCPEAKFLSDDCALSGDAPARPGTTMVTVPNVPPGHYAAQVFHDENNNHKVDRALFGIPKEGIGFSRDAPIGFGPPKWRDAVFEHRQDGQAIRLNMRYYLGAKGPGPAGR
jgi:uncharacterized protein (DUF2141 family)